MKHHGGTTTSMGGLSIGDVSQGAWFASDIPLTHTASLKWHPMQKHVVRGLEVLGEGRKQRSI